VKLALERHAPFSAHCFVLNHPPHTFLSPSQHTHTRVQYFKHMESHPQSLVTHFFGVHGIKEVHGRTVRFMVMSNIFCTELQIHKKFDLKVRLPLS